MAIPNNNIDSNGRLIAVGDGVALRGQVISLSGGRATVLVSDAYYTLMSQRSQVTVGCYNIVTTKTNSSS